MPHVVRTPRLNANEDQVLVVSLNVAPGQTVAEGDLLAVLESTKAASEVLAPVAGTVKTVAAAEKQMVDVGSDLVVIEAAEGAAAGPGEAEAEAAAEDAAGVRVSAKARRRARELGVDVDQVPPRDGRVRVEDVEDFAAARPAGEPVEPAVHDGPAVILGGGGHAACLIDALADGPYQVLGCTDSALAAGTEVLAGICVLGDDKELERLRAEGIAAAFVGLGGVTDNAPRRHLFDRAQALGFVVPPLVHPTAHVGRSVSLGPGVQVLANASVGPRCRIGANVIVNQGAVVCHDSVIGDDGHIAPGAVVAGGVHIGARTTVGMAATVLFGARVGADCLIHNGASVTGDVSDGLEVTRGGARRPRAEEAQT